MRQFATMSQRVLFALGALLAFSLPAQKVSAAVIQVGEACSLHDAIVAANTDSPAGGCPAGAGADTIWLSGDVTLSEELPAIESVIAIEGDGHTISGDGKFRIFDVHGGSLTIRRMTLADGQSHDPEVFDRDGGAIRANDATIVIENSSLINNAAEYGGGAIYGSETKLTVSGSSFSGNRAKHSGGAIDGYKGKVSITSSSFVDNRASSGGAIYILDSTMKVQNSTFSHNAAKREGGAIAMGNHEKVTLNHVTIAYNSAPTSGGIYSRSTRLRITNSIVAENSPNDCLHVAERNEGNLLQRGNCDQAVRADPLLLPLVGNPAYHPLRDYSPAINAALDEHCTSHDQAGNPRPMPTDKRCDIGAIESASGIEALPTPVPTHCTLEDRIIAAITEAPSGACPAGDGAETIEITDDITLSQPLPSIRSKITIEGNGHSISGDNHYQIFHIDGGDLTINDMTLKHGYGIDGGAIGVTNGALTINNSVICENQAESDAGAIYAEESSTMVISYSTICDNINHGYTGGGIEIRGKSSLVLKNSTVKGNTVDSEGGGIYLWDSEAAISGSVISGNRARLGGAIYSRGPAVLTITGSSIHNNSAFHDGGGLSVNYETVLTLDNSTISHNHTEHLSWQEGYSTGGGIDSYNSAVMLNHVTLAHNRAGDGGGINIYGGSLDMRNSIIADNAGGDCYIRAQVDLIEVAGNFFGDGTCEKNSTRAAHLLPLTDSKPYHSLKPESPAVNAADPDHCLPVDQLGNMRPAGEGCDIGAIESPHEVAIVPTPATHCSLANQILAANRDEPVGACPAGKGADTISIQANITLDCSLPPITSEITIEGNGFTISGDNRFQIFYVIGGKLTVNNATLINGKGYGGGAISVRDGGELTIRNSSLRDNWAVAGGAVLSYGRTTIENSNFSGNYADYLGGAIAIYSSDLLVAASAMNQNESGRSAGAIYLQNAGAEVTNTTLSGNSAARSGGAIDELGSSTDLVHVTIANNSAPDFGGISGNSGYVNLRNSILANNSGGDCDDSSEFSAQFTTHNSLIGEGNCDADLSGDPMLGDLEENGYHPLLPGSPAIDSADPRFCPPTDQLGKARPGGDGCDLGAVESLGASS